MNTSTGNNVDLEIWLTERTHFFPGTLGMLMLALGTLDTGPLGTLELVPRVTLGTLEFPDSATGLFSEYDSDASCSS